jgi:hypothetical protein
MPALVSYAQPGLSIVTLGQFEEGPETAGDYDALILAPAPPRADPCAALLERMKARPRTAAGGRPAPRPAP